MAEDAWESYDRRHHPGHPHPHPIIPEPATYGLCLICVVLIILLIRKTKK